MGTRRQAAAEIKYEVINHLDQYLEQFARNLEARGAKVFWAADAKEARDYIVKVARQNSVRHIIKSKSMTTEEIHLNEALQEAGFEVFESDLGEFIVQLATNRPIIWSSPPCTSCAAKSATSSSRNSGGSRAGTGGTHHDARRVMRQKFCQADLGISGVNFGVAETGMINITEKRGERAALHLAAAHSCGGDGH